MYKGEIYHININPILLHCIAFIYCLVAVSNQHWRYTARAVR